MTQSLNDFLQEQNNTKHATDTGTSIHKLMQHVFFDDNEHYSGDTNIINNIKQHPEIWEYFKSTTQTEIPIAGYIKDNFVSKRIDRLSINHDTKSIVFIDYKTDNDKLKFFNEYKKQLVEYSILLKSAYPEYTVSGFILWIQDWTLSKVV